MFSGCARRAVVAGVHHRQAAESPVADWHRTGTFEEQGRRRIRAKPPVEVPGLDDLGGVPSHDEGTPRRLPPQSLRGVLFAHERKDPMAPRGDKVSEHVVAPLTFVSPTADFALAPLMYVRAGVT